MGQIEGADVASSCALLLGGSFGHYQTLSGVSATPGLGHHMRAVRNVDDGLRRATLRFPGWACAAWEAHLPCTFRRNSDGRSLCKFSEVLNMLLVLESSSLKGGGGCVQPFDDQELMIKLQMFNWIGQPVIDIVPSAAGALRPSSPTSAAPLVRLWQLARSACVLETLADSGTGGKHPA